MAEEKKNKTVNSFIILLVVFLVIFVVFISFYKPNNGGDFLSGLSFVEHNNFKIYENSIDQNNTIYVLELFAGDIRYLHYFFYLPEDLEDVYVEDGVVDKLLYKEGKNEYKEKIYITRDPAMDAKEKLAFSTLTQVLGKTEAGLFKFIVKIAYTGEYGGDDFPIITCGSAFSEISVLEQRYGELEIYSEDDCVIVQGEDYVDFRQAADKLTYMVLGVIEE